MECLSTAKSTQNKALAEKLKATPGKTVEDNTLGGTFWGMCHGRWENRLGRMLMQLRDML